MKSEVMATEDFRRAWRRFTNRMRRIVGRKIGLTSKAIQQQLAVSEPDYGTLWQSSFYETKGGRVSIPSAHMNVAGMLMCACVGSTPRNVPSVRSPNRR